jgi:hypothetical protein
LELDSVGTCVHGNIDELLRQMQFAVVVRPGFCNDECGAVVTYRHIINGRIMHNGTL